MLKRISPSVIVAAFVVALVFAAFPAASVQAFADVDVVTQSCSTLYAEGTSNAKYVIFAVYTVDSEYWTAVPVENGHYIGNLVFPEQEADTLIDYYVWGSPEDDWNYWDNESYYYDAELCVPLVPGPTHPPAFVQRSFVCDTPLYVRPAGEVIPKELIKAGQTFHVNPTGVAGSDGKMWHQVFVGSNNLPYVPASCIGP